MEDTLKMIESVDPSDAAKLDEIDKRVRCFLIEKQYESIKDWKTFYADKYTRSRDVLKAIRPEGWHFHTMNHYGCLTPDNFWKMEFCNHDNTQRLATKGLPTEEFAELSAILQAINYERTKP